MLFRHGALDALSVLRVGGELLSLHGFTPDALVASYVDLVQRGQVGGSDAETLLAFLDATDDSTLGIAAAPLRRFGELLVKEPSRAAPDPTDDVLPEIEYMGFFAKDRARARAVKRRAMGKNPRRED